MAKGDPDTGGRKWREFQWSRNAGRKNPRTRHNLDGLRGIRVLSFVLSHRGAAACTVWGAGISTSELETEIRGYTVQSFGDILMGVEARTTVPLNELKASAAATEGDVALFWLMPAEDAPAACVSGLIDCAFREYVTRLEEFTEHVKAQGATPIIVECPLNVMQSEILRLPENDRTVTSALVRLVALHGLTFESAK